MAGLVLVAFSTLAPSAHAAKKRVGVSVNGMPAGPVRGAITDVLKHHGFESVSPDLSSDSEDAVASAARQSKLVAVVVGEVREGGKRLKLRVYGATGDLIGEGSWSEKGGPKKLATAVERTLWARVGGAISKAHGGAAEKPAREERAEREVTEEGSAKKASAVEETPTYSRSKEADAPRESAEESEPPRSKRGKKKRESSDEAEAVASKSSAGGGGGGAAGSALDLGVSSRFVMRSLNWNGSSTLSTYSLGLAPSLGATIGWYPAAHFMSGWQSNLGLFVSIEYTPGLSSQRGAMKFPTQENDYWGGARGRVLLGPAELSATLGGGQHGFIFRSGGGADRGTLATLPDVKYTFLRAGADARIKLPANLALMLGGGYRAVLGAGNVNYLVESANFLPNAKVSGFDATASVGYRFLPVLEGRGGFDIRRYMISASGNPSMTTAGTDQYLAFWLQLAVVLDGTGAKGGDSDDDDEAPEAKPAKREKREKPAESEDEE